MNGSHGNKRCAGCGKLIRTRYFVQSLGKEWHESCLRCDVCKESLYSFGENKLYFKKGRMLCKNDYMRYAGMFLGFGAKIFVRKLIERSFGTLLTMNFGVK